MNEANRKTVFGSILPLIAAIIWGTAFVIQSMVTEYMDALTFNALRGFVAFIALFILTRIIKPKEKQNKKQLILGGISCGFALFVASNLQQAGLAFTSAGKAGFITAFYMILVPIMGIFLKKKTPVKVWICALIAIIGLYFICIKSGEGAKFDKGDLLILLCAIVFAIHIHIIDHFNEYVDGICLSCVQFLVVGILSAIGALLFESPSPEGIVKCIWPILYMGVLSSGVAYTIEIVSLKFANPTVVTILLSMESVFAVIAEALIFKTSMNGREFFGCGLMLIAVILSQINIRKKA